MRILIAEDDRVSRRLLESTLQKWQYEVVVTADGAEAWAALQADDCPDLAILDWMMPVFEGPELCRKLRDAGKNTYVILLTARGGKDDIVSGLEAGADDYVPKPFNHQELHARLQVGARIVGLQKANEERVRELEVLTRRLEELSYVDQLTGIPNRRQLDMITDREWGRALRRREPVAILMLDIDSFKNFNDHYGHQAGDECLRRVGAALKAAIHRSPDCVGRYGGEEFLALLPGTDEEGMRKVAESMRSNIEALAIPHGYCRSNIGVATVSIGAALCIPTGEGGHAELVARADAALYLAKESGGNCVRTAPEP